MINTIVFDLSEVLLTGIKETGAKLGRTHGLNDGPLAHPLLHASANELFRGRLSEIDYLQNILTDYPVLGTVEELQNIIRQGFYEIEGTRTIIEKLRRLGYKIGLLSIHAEDWVTFCEEKFDYHQYFHSISYSYSSGALKPESEAFQAILESLCSQPEETLFIDDYSVNVEAAKQLGLSGVVFENAEQLHEELLELLADYSD